MKCDRCFERDAVIVYENLITHMLCRRCASETLADMRKQFASLLKAVRVFDEAAKKQESQTS